MYMRAEVVLTSYTQWGRIFDFGNGAGEDNVLLTFADDRRDLMLQVFRHGVAKQISCKPPIHLNTRYTVEVSIAHDGNAGVGVVGRVYVDGQQCAEGPLHLPEAVRRSSTLIGASNWAGNLPLKGTVDTFAVYTCGVPRPSCDERDIVNVQVPSESFAEEAPLRFGGPIYVHARVALNSHTQWGRIIDFGNGPEADNILITLQDNTKQIAVSVYRDGAQQGGGVLCPVEAPLGTSFTVEATILREGSSDTQGEATIYIDGVGCARGPVHLPAVVERRKNYVGHSHWAGNARLEGMVSSLVVSSCARQMQMPCEIMKRKASFDDSTTELGALTFGGGMYLRAIVTFTSYESPEVTIFSSTNGLVEHSVALKVVGNLPKNMIWLSVSWGASVWCPFDVVLNTAITVEATVTASRWLSAEGYDGLGSIAINGVRCVSEYAMSLPELLYRRTNLIGYSSGGRYPPIGGTVKDFELSTCL